MYAFSTFWWIPFCGAIPDSVNTSVMSSCINLVFKLFISIFSLTSEDTFSFGLIFISFLIGLPTLPNALFTLSETVEALSLPGTISASKVFPLGAGGSGGGVLGEGGCALLEPGGSPCCGEGNFLAVIPAHSGGTPL